MNAKRKRSAPSTPEGWKGRVVVSEAGGFAHTPDEVLVRARDAGAARDLLAELQGDTDVLIADGERGSFQLLQRVVDPPRAVEILEGNRIPAQPNHVLFAHCGCCAPHPAMLCALGANPFGANPFGANPFGANPFGANPFGANPFGANPFGANPFGANPFGANPFGANPFGANGYSAGEFQPNPHYLVAYAGRHPEALRFQATGFRRHSARPAEAPELPTAPPRRRSPLPPSIVVLDTGLASGGLCPNALTGVQGHDLTLPSGKVLAQEDPDEDGDNVIDPVAGHGTFIAGIIERICPGRQLRVAGLLNGYGSASEDDIAAVLDSLHAGGPGPDLLNLSLGGYTAVNMARLGESVRKLQDAGTTVVASAGNDSTCRPQFPAGFPGVVSVGAIGPNGPAPFTNYGPWVRACAPGVDVVSTFFTAWDPPTGEGETYKEWVRWSGTSFAAPAVVGALARAMSDGLTGQEAVHRLIDDPYLLRIPGLGTVVNQPAMCQR